LDQLPETNAAAKAGEFSEREAGQAGGKLLVKPKRKKPV